MADHFSPTAVLKDGSLVTSAFEWDPSLHLDWGYYQNTIDLDIRDASFFSGRINGGSENEHDELRKQIDWEATKLLAEAMGYD